MIERLKEGTILRNSSDFIVLRNYAQTYLKTIYPENAEPGIRARMRRHIKYSKLNTRLSFYGWGIKKDGEMVAVRTRSDVDVSKPNQLDWTYRPQEDRKVVKKGLISHGYMVDPATGRVVSMHERREYGL